MKKVPLKKMIAAATELNDLFNITGTPDAIQTANVKEDYLTTKLKEAAELLTPEDELTVETEQVLLDLGFLVEEEIPQPDDEGMFEENPDANFDPEEELPVQVGKVTAPKPEKVQGLPKQAKGAKDVVEKPPKEKKVKEPKPEKPPKEKKPKPEKFTSTNPYDNNAWVAALALKEGKPKTKKEWAEKVKELREANGCAHSEITTKFWIRYVPFILDVFGIKVDLPK